jgi:hypothetical protein
MEQTVMVLIVVGLAAGYLARAFYKKIRPGRSPCDCGCTGCSPAPYPTNAAGGRCSSEAGKSKI